MNCSFYTAIDRLHLAAAAAIEFLPVLLLAARFDYPDILRRPTGEVLERFRAGGSELVLIWWAFTLTALFFSAVVVLLAIAVGAVDRWVAVRHHPPVPFGPRDRVAGHTRPGRAALMRKCACVASCRHGRDHGATGRDPQDAGQPAPARDPPSARG